MANIAWENYDAEGTEAFQHAKGNADDYRNDRLPLVHTLDQ